MIRSIVVVLLLFLSIVAVAQAANSEIVLTRNQFRSSVCNVESMVVAFKIEVSAGELLIRSKMRWQAGPNTALDCLSQLTDVFVKALQPNGSSVFIKLNPRIVNAGNTFGPSLTTSPDWDSLLCDGTNRLSTCLPGETARSMLAQLEYETIQIVADASGVLSRIKSLQTQPKNESDSVSSSFAAFEDMLAEPGSAKVVVTELTDDVSEEKVPQTRSDPRLVAEEAVKEVTTLLTTSLAKYETPAHSCESVRRISNWVSVESTCKISFRRESSHNFLCSVQDEKREIVSTDTVNLDFSEHLDDMEQFRQTTKGPVVLVLRLSDNIASIRGDYQVNRWQFTGGIEVAGKIETLANSFASIKEYCVGSI